MESSAAFYPGLKTIFFFLSAIFLAACLMLNASGYCEGMFPTSEQKIKQVLNSLQGDWNLKKLGYDDADELIKMNPECCVLRVDSDYGEAEYQTTFFDRIFGRYAGTVSYTFKLPIIVEGKKVLGSKIMSGNRFVSNCGEAWSW